LNAAGENLLFQNPREILLAHTPEEARAALMRLEEAQAEGLHAAGYFAYELGFLFEERLTPRLPARSEAPLLWFGLSDAPERLTIAEADAFPAAHAGASGKAVDIEANLDFPPYERAFDRVKAYIADGDTYQVNLTFKARFRLEGDAVALYRELVQKQPV